MTEFLKRQIFSAFAGQHFISSFLLYPPQSFYQHPPGSQGAFGKSPGFWLRSQTLRIAFSGKKYLGVDIEVTGHDHKLSKVDVYYDGKTLPFENDSFDSLFCSEVLEHVFNPDEILPEILRVLKPGARALITTPFCWNEHEQPYDYARYSSFGMTHLLEKNGFRVVKLVKSGHFLQVQFQLMALYFYEIFRPLGKPGFFLSQLFITPINLFGALVSFLLPKNNTMYFNNIVIAEKATRP